MRNKAIKNFTWKTSISSITILFMLTAVRAGIMKRLMMIFFMFPVVISLPILQLDYIKTFYESWSGLYISVSEKALMWRNVSKIVVWSLHYISWIYFLRYLGESGTLAVKHYVMSYLAWGTRHFCSPFLLSPLISCAVLIIL